MKKLCLLLALFGITGQIFSMEEGNSKKTNEEIENTSSKTLNNNNTAPALGEKPITKAMVSGSHARFTSILQPYNKTHDFMSIVKLMHEEGLTIKKFILNFFNNRWINLYYNMLVKKDISNPKLKTIELLKKSSEMNNTMVDESPAVEFSDSIPANLRLLINKIVQDHSLLSKKYFYVKTFKDEPRTLKESAGKLITFAKNGELQLNIELKANEDYNKGVIIHEITHAVIGESWMKQILLKENLHFTKAMNHLVEREADLLLTSTNKEYAKLVQEHLETLHKEQPDEESETHPSTISRLEDIIYLNKLLEAEEKLK